MRLRQAEGPRYPGAPDVFAISQSNTHAMQYFSLRTGPRGHCALSRAVGCNSWRQLCELGRTAIKMPSIACLRFPKRIEETRRPCQWPSVLGERSQVPNLNPRLGRTQGYTELGNTFVQATVEIVPEIRRLISTDCCDPSR